MLEHGSRPRSLSRWTFHFLFAYWHYSICHSDLQYSSFLRIASIYFRKKERQERAMQRLQELYLYSESAMLEEDFIIRKS